MSSTQHIYPPVEHGEASQEPPSPMGARLHATAERFRAMTEAAIAESHATSAPATSTGPPPKVTRVNWDEQVDREALVMRRRQPTDWLANQVVVGAAAVQVVPYRLNRKSLTVTNTGANPATISATESAANNDTSSTMVLAAAASITMETEAAVWGISSSGTTLTVVETYYGRQQLNSAVAALMEMARLRAGAPHLADVPTEPERKGEAGLK